MKKILLFIDWFTPGYKAGGPVRSCVNLVSHFSNEYEFFILTTNTDYCETEPYGSIESDRWNSFSNNVNIYYFSKKNMNIKNLNKIIKCLKFDVAYINGVYSFYFSIIPLVLLKILAKKNTVVAPRGMLSQHALKIKSTRKKLYLNFAKLIGLFENTVFQATNQDEEVDIKNQLGSETKVVVAPNLPAKHNFQKTSEIKKKAGKLRLVSIARIAPEKNTKFALQCLLNCRAKLIFNLYGSIYNKKYWTECKEIISQLPENVEVYYNGSIESNKVHETIAGSHFLLMPTCGENYGHTIIESLSVGRPVIISNRTPWNNLEQQGIGWDIALDDIGLFEKTIQKCGEMNQQQFNQLSENAFRFAKKVVNDKSLIEKTKAVFK